MTDILTDWKIFSIDFESYFNGDESHTASEYELILQKITQLCNEDGNYTVDCWKDKYTVRLKSEIESIHLADMTEEEQAVYMEEKAQAKRDLRSLYLHTYVDPVVTNPLRWEELSEEEQTEIKNYRQYLLDVPQQTDFPNIEIMTFDEWKPIDS